jgi:hypothetical protein
MSQTSYSSTMSFGIEGQLADNGANDVLSKVNGAAAEIEFGMGVIRGASDEAVILPSAETDVIIGIALHSHAYALGTELDTGIEEEGSVSMLRKGRVLVLVEEAVTAGDRGWCRAVSGAGGTRLGAWRKSDVGTETIDCTKQAVFITSAAEDALAVLEVDFTAKP